MQTIPFKYSQSFYSTSGTGQKKYIKTWIAEGASLGQTLVHSNSTKPNQFCLEIILCSVGGAFDYLIYPYYPAYMR